MVDSRLVDLLNNRWTCEWSAAIRQLDEIPPSEAAEIVFTALNPRLMGTRPHSIALGRIGFKDPEILLNALNNERKIVRDCARSAIMMYSDSRGDRYEITTVDELLRFRRNFVEFGAKPGNEKHS